MLKLLKFIVAAIAFIHTSNAQTVTGVCFCVPTGSCTNGTGGTGGAGEGQIDIRIQTGTIPSTGASGTSSQLTTAAFPGINPTVNSQTTCANGLVSCCPTAGFQCGYRFPPVVGSRLPLAGQSQYGSYPWQAVILDPADNSFQGSGILIDNLHIMTAAHKVVNFTTNNKVLKVRLGEWDASATTEPLPAQEYNVARIFVHPAYVAANLKNNIAILRLATPVTLGQFPTITTACIPNSVVTGIRCWVTGWGRNEFSSVAPYQATQKEVDVPIVDQATCQTQLRATRLGANFTLDTSSFICAGGELGKDACTGDGGSPLSCQIANNWYVVGMVAWGIGCGQANVPGVYVNIANYVSWIQTTLRT